MFIPQCNNDRNIPFEIQSIRFDGMGMSPVWSFAKPKRNDRCVTQSTIVL